jgi:hypothetical protein
MLHARLLLLMADAACLLVAADGKCCMLHARLLLLMADAACSLAASATSGLPDDLSNSICVIAPIKHTLGKGHEISASPHLVDSISGKRG